MEIMKEFMNIDFSNVFWSVFVILIGTQAVVSVWEWIVTKLGLETKGMQEKRKEHNLLIQTSQDLSKLQAKHEESVKQSIRHDEMIKEDISSLTNTVNGIVDTLNIMQQKENKTKVKELRESLIRYYNKYKNIGEWSKLESGAFWDLFNDYEERVGDGYIHTIVEPVMRELREIQ